MGMGTRGTLGVLEHSQSPAHVWVGHYAPHCERRIVERCSPGMDSPHPSLERLLVYANGGRGKASSYCVRELGHRRQRGKMSCGSFAEAPRPQCVSLR